MSNPPFFPVPHPIGRPLPGLKGAVPKPVRPTPAMMGIKADPIARDPVQSFAETAPVYVGRVRLLFWSSTPTAGMSIKVALLDSDLEINPFKGMKVGKTGLRGQRLRLVLTLDSETDKGALYQGEAILQHWQDDPLDGLSVKIRLDDSIDGASRHPCEAMPFGREDGEVFLFTAWAIADDEQPEAPERASKRRPFAQLNPVVQSNILCNDTTFVEFLVLHIVDQLEASPHPLPSAKDQPKAFAEVVVRSFCGITSRAQLNGSDDVAEQARINWQNLLRSYETWRWGDARRPYTQEQDVK